MTPIKAISSVHSWVTSGRSLGRNARVQRKLVTCALSEEEAERLRGLPLLSSALGIATVIGSKVLSGAQPALVASSSESRADVAAIIIAAVLGLTGLQWLSVKPKKPVNVTLDGEKVNYFSDSVRDAAMVEILGFWDALAIATKVEIMVIFWKGKCIAHLGYKRPDLTPGTAQLGQLCKESQEKNIPRYLANLVLFPGRMEFLDYLPSNTQSLLVQPLHPDGVVVLGSPTQRSFTILDQAWIATWCDKLDSVLSSTTEN